jgi:hypothetical protein
MNMLQTSVSTRIPLCIDRCVKAMALVTMGFTTFACARYIDATPVDPQYVRVDGDNDVAIATKNIRWIQRYHDSFYICATDGGCFESSDIECGKWQVSASNNPESYKQIEQMFGTK